MIGIGDWFVQMFIKHLRRLGPNQIRDLIHNSDEVETLVIIQKHLMSGDFKYWHGVMAMKERLLDDIAKRLMEMGAFQ